MWRRGKSRSASGVFTNDLLLDGGECRASRETQTMYGMVLGTTSVSLAGSHRSSLLQNSLLRCLAARYCHREDGLSRIPAKLRADKALPENEVGDQRSPPRNGGKKPFLYECPPVEGSHHAEG